MLHTDLTLLRAFDRLISDGPGGEEARDVRGVVADSWRRSLAAGVSESDVISPFGLSDHDLRDYRTAHALSSVFPLLYDVLGRAAEDCDTVMAVGDAQGRLLWVCGRPAMLRRAEGIQFVEGASWGEGDTGTNAPGLAVRLDQPVAIRSAEHFTSPLKEWSCAAAPIHDPMTQEILGVVDVTGGAEAASVQSLAMVRAAARMAEAELGRLAVVGSLEDTGGRAAPEMDVHIESLGGPDCLVTTAVGTHRLSRRHGEILTILASEPQGVVGETLDLEVYGGDAQSVSTVRAEVTRLRSLLGGEVVRSRPYRLEGRVSSDWGLVERHLDAGEIHAALRSYRGRLLPQSSAPGIVARREQLEQRVRAAVLTSCDLDLLTAWTKTRAGVDDLEAWEQQCRLLPEWSPLAAMSQEEVARLRIEFGLDPRTGQLPA